MDKLTSSNIGKNGDFRGHLDVTEKKFPEETSKGSSPPLMEWVEDKFVASISISERIVRLVEAFLD
jgi:hypothetical protein